ncbi:Tricin synthase 1 [Morus notabilis]|uniref:Tricin synthase 1 n=1 Tax=Morus notabilis TaxID=981085 RepID=W9QMH7_9ROSA|nr:Tricin synthase 1 [Morus notabilis]
MGSCTVGLQRLSILSFQNVVSLHRPNKSLLKLHSLSAITPVSGFPKIKPSQIIRSCSTNSFAVADDGKYSNKQVISITPRLYDYILANVREPEILRQLREETASMRGSQMQVSPDQAQLLAMLVQILGAERCIEVGVYTIDIHSTSYCYETNDVQEFKEVVEIQGTVELERPFEIEEGYSSLAVALALPESGLLVACERDAKSLEVAEKYYARANVSHKVHVKHGLAVDSLKSLISNGEACSIHEFSGISKESALRTNSFDKFSPFRSYDFAFVDAEKRMYQEYFELLLQLVRVGGVIVVDNVLWNGKVADPMVNDAKTASIRSFNKSIMEDQRVSISMVPIGDGITICRKR